VKPARKKSTHKKRTVYELLPKYFQPKVTKKSQTVCQVIHWDFVDQFARGIATPPHLWGWVEACLTYSEMMRLLSAEGTEFTPEAGAAMVLLLEIQPQIIERFKTTGLIEFTADELAVCKAGALVMDEMVQIDKYGIAWASRQWSNARMEHLKKETT
jgi:hypothetical protein